MTKQIFAEGEGSSFVNDRLLFILCLMSGFPTATHVLDALSLPQCGFARLRQWVGIGAILATFSGAAEHANCDDFRTDPYGETGTGTNPGTADPEVLPSPPLPFSAADEVRRYATDLQNGRSFDPSAVDKFDRQEMVEYLAEYFCRVVPNGWPEQYEYFAYASLFHALDQRYHDDACSSQVRAELNTFLDTVAAGYETSALPNEEIDCCLRQLNMLADLLPNNERDLCRSKMRELEHDFVARFEKDFSTFIDRDVAAIKRGSQLRETTARDNFAVALEGDYDLAIKPYAASFTREINHYVYIKHGSAGDDKWIVGLLDPDHNLPAEERRLNERRVIFRHSVTPSAVLLLSREDFLQAMRENSLSDRLGYYAADYNERHTAETIERLHKIDLPPEGLVAFLRIFPDHGDRVVDHDLLASTMLRSALLSRYPGRVIAPDILYTDSPAKEIIFQISQLREVGVTHFIFSVNHHGSRHSVAFRDPMGAAEARAIGEQYSELPIWLKTPACFGGGWPDIYPVSQSGNPTRNISVMTETQRHMVNQSGDTPGYNGNLSITSRNTFYGTFLLDALRDRARSFGAAHDYADEQSAIYSGLDAWSSFGGEVYTYLTPRGVFQLAGR